MTDLIGPPHNQHRSIEEIFADLKAGPRPQRIRGQRDHPCSRCGGPRDRDSAAYCRTCAAEYQRQWRAAGRESLTPEDKHRHAVRQSTLRKLQRWKLRPRACALCQQKRSEPIECHHPSYEGKLASWRFATLHRSCHDRLHDGVLEEPELVDLRILDWANPGPWLERVTA